MRLIIDFWIDGYETEADMEAAAPEAVYELLSSAGTSVKVVSESEENKRMREALERCQSLANDIYEGTGEGNTIGLCHELGSVCEEALK